MFHTTFSLKAASVKEQEFTLKEANHQQSTRHLTCSMDDPDVAIEKQELDGEEMSVGQEQSDEWPAVLEVADDDPGDTPTHKVDVNNCVNLTVCEHLKAYRRKSVDGWPYPDDWQSRNEDGAANIPDNEHKETQLSPEGQIFNSRIGAYKYLLKYGTKEQVQEMRTLLGHDGWKDYALLPAGWLYKKKDYNNLYLTDLGEKLSGNRLALKFCKENEKYALKLNDMHRFLQEQKTGKFSTSLEESYSTSTRTGHLRWLKI